LFTSSGLLTFDAVKASIADRGQLGAEFSASGLGKAEVFQLIFGYFALSGLLGVDWGMAVRDRRDIRIGGWISIILAGSYCCVLSLLTVAGAVGKMGHRQTSFGDGLPMPLTFHWAVFQGIGGMTGGVILLLFGLATLAPGCYAVGISAQRFSARWPLIRRNSWIWLTGVGAFLLVGSSLAGRIEDVFDLIGAVFAPAAGALVADALRQKGNWPGVRSGWNPPGMIAWVAGGLVGLVPLMGRLFDWPAPQAFQPAALYGFLVASCLFLILSALGLDRPVLTLGKATVTQAPTAL
jgi:purine-cytosine permease-like protein